MFSCYHALDLIFTFAKGKKKYERFKQRQFYLFIDLKQKKIKIHSTQKEKEKKSNKIFSCDLLDYAESTNEEKMHKKYVKLMPSQKQKTK